jgi:protein gp37
VEQKNPAGGSFLNTEVHKKQPGIKSMSANSKIEWTMRTWNPCVGCSIVSPGCHHCYAATMAKRLRAMALADIAAGRDPGRKRHYIDVVDEDGRWTGKVNPVPEALQDPLHWRKPQTVFVNSMSDLFHESLPFEFIDQVFAVMALAHQHTFQVLTKRADRMAEYFDASPHVPLPNVWLGVSVEDQKRADARREAFRTVPAAVKFVSYEPALGPVNWSGWDFIDWLIAGGESGHDARPAHPDWHRAARDWCQATETAFFFKQYGEWAPRGCGAKMSRDDRTIGIDGRPKFPGDMNLPEFGFVTLARVGKGAAGRVLDGRTWDEMPEPV